MRRSASEVQYPGGFLAGMGLFTHSRQAAAGSRPATASPRMFPVPVNRTVPGNYTPLPAGAEARMREDLIKHLESGRAAYDLVSALAEQIMAENAAKDQN